PGSAIRVAARTSRESTPPDRASRTEAPGDPAHAAARDAVRTAARRTCTPQGSPPGANTSGHGDCSGRGSPASPALKGMTSRAAGGSIRTSWHRVVVERGWLAIVLDHEEARAAVVSTVTGRPRA